MADPSLLWADAFEYPDSEIALHYNYVLNGSSVNAIGTTYGTGSRRGFGTSANANSNLIGKTVLDLAASSFEGRFIVLGGSPSVSTLYQVAFYDAVGSTNQITLRLGSDNLFRVYRGSTLIATFLTAIVPNVYYHVGIKVLINSSTGTLLTTLNGVTQNNLTGINTQISNAFTSRIDFGINAVSSTTDALRVGWSDVCIQADASASNVSLRGDCAALRLAVTSDATPNDGTTTSGTDHYAMVDDGNSGHDGDTTTLTLSTTGNEERFGHENLPASVTAVKAVCQRAVTKKDDAGTAKYKFRLRISSTNYDSAQFAPSLNTYDEHYKGRILNPDTSAEFTPGEVDALVGGFVRDDS